MTKCQIIEEPCNGKLLCTDLKTSGYREVFAEFNHRKTSYKRFGKSISYFDEVIAAPAVARRENDDQQAILPEFKEFWTDYKRLNAGSLQATVKRVDFAFMRFFKGVGGYPKFQSIRKYSGWTYPDVRQGFRVHSTGVNGYLELRDLGFRFSDAG